MALLCLGAVNITSGQPSSLEELNKNEPNDTLKRLFYIFDKYYNVPFLLTVN